MDDGLELMLKQKEYLTAGEVTALFALRDISNSLVTMQVLHSEL